MSTSQEIWRIKRQPSGTIEPDLFDIEAVDAVNRYATHFTAWMDDPTGDKGEEYEYGQRAALEYSTDGGSTWARDMAGFLVQKEDGGFDNTGQFQALFVGYDHLLRRNQMFQEFTATTVLSALQTVIEEWTPINWAPGNVTVTNNDTIDRVFQGTVPDEAISFLASASANEEYGVNADFEFFFRPRNTRSAPGDLLEGKWFDYDLPEENRHTVNWVRVWYGQSPGDSSVVVEDKSNQQELQNKLGAPRPVVLAESRNYPEIDNKDAARAAAEEILENRKPLLTGTVGTWSRPSWEPGQVFRLEIPEKNIDTTFRIAELRHRWSQAQTDLKIAENTGNVEDLLVAMSDDITRIDLRGIDPTQPYTRFLDLATGATVSISAAVSQTTIDPNAFDAGFVDGDTAGFVTTDTVNAGLSQAPVSVPAGRGAATTAALNQFRDVWQGESPDTIDTVKIGTGSSAPVQTDTDLQTVTLTDTATSVTASGSYDIEFTYRLSQGSNSGLTIREFGFFDTDGQMHNRAVLDDDVTHGSKTETTLTVTFTIDTDPQRNGVITNTGQQRLRDLYLGDVTIADYHADDRAYGTGTTTETVTDTSLGTKIGEVQIAHEDGEVGEDIGEITIGTGEANGNTITEMGNENDVNELLSRIVFAGTDKTTSFDLVSDETFRIRAVIT